jgi:ketosteroid isomerase-like protein
MAVTTLANIKASAADWLNRTDLTTQIDDFATLASSEMQRKLNTTSQTSIIDHTVTASEATAKKFYMPDGATGILSITDSKGRNLASVSYKDYEVYTTESGDGCVYAVAGGEIYIGPPPAENDVFTIQFRDGDSTYLTAYRGADVVALPEVLLMGILMNAYIYLKDDNRVPFFKDKFYQGIEDYNRKSSSDLGMGRITDDSIAANGGPLA